MLQKLVISTIIKQVISSIFGALKGNESLQEYGKILLKKAKGDVVKYQLEEAFWKDAIGVYLHEPGQRRLITGKAVELRNFLITEWFPRCPGLIWTSQGEEYRLSAEDYTWDRSGDNYVREIRDYTSFVGKKMGVYAPMGKSRMVLGGLGTTRLEKIEDTSSGTEYRILCATSSGICDQGIPLLVAEGVYEKLNESLTTEGVIGANLTGFYSEIPVHWGDTLIKVPGSEELSQKLQEELQTTLHVPRHCIVIKSPNTVDTQSVNDNVHANIRATAWTLFKSSFLFDGYSFTFGYFDPRSEESINRASKFILEYVQSLRGEEIYTEFDRKIARLHSLSSEIPRLSHSKFVEDQMSRSSEEIIKWAFRLQENHRFTRSIANKHGLDPRTV